VVLIPCVVDDICVVSVEYRVCITFVARMSVTVCVIGKAIPLQAWTCPGIEIPRFQDNGHMSALRTGFEIFLVLISVSS
jgi:hypothetical protein